MRSWWRTQHLVMITRNLLSWVCRSLKTSLTQQSCAGSCILSSQLPHSKYKAEPQENPRILGVLLLEISLPSVCSLCRNSIALACSTPLLGQNRYHKILSRGTQILPHSNW